MAVWDDVIPAAERHIYENDGWSKRMGFGTYPTVIVIDVKYDFVGDQPVPIMQPIKHWRYSCGEAGWRAVQAIDLRQDSVKWFEKGDGFVAMLDAPCRPLTQARWESWPR